MTNVQLMNLALAKIGVSNGVASLSEQSLEATMGSLVFDHILRATLRLFPWGFATKYADPLTLVAGRFWDSDPTVLDTVAAWDATVQYPVGYVVRVGGVNYSAIATSLNQTPPNLTYWIPSTTAYDEDYPEQFNPDWLYAYRWPTDCITARRLVKLGVGRTWDDNPVPWKVGRDTWGLMIWTNEPLAVLEYTVIDCDALWTDDLWIQAFAWRLAAELAPTCSRNEMTFTTCFEHFVLALRTARQLSHGEQEPERVAEGSEWTRAR
jgi:hypothetical protein